MTDSVQAACQIDADRGASGTIDDLEPLQWIFAVLGAFMVGVSKTGITGLSILSVALFTHVFPSSKQASGIVLPLLIFGDFVAVFSYRRAHSMALSVEALSLDGRRRRARLFRAGPHLRPRARLMIGVIIVSLGVLSFWRRYRPLKPGRPPRTRHWMLAAAVGVVAGFITLVANAAGPLMAIYLVAMRLPKMEYVGTAAVFFMCSISSRCRSWSISA